jgi:hypothetical protein
VTELAVEFAVEFAGWVGAGALLGAFVLVSSGRLAARGLAFQLLNVAGAVGLVVNGAWHAAWPSVGLNVVWVAVGLAALARVRRPVSADL